MAAGSDRRVRHPVTRAVAYDRLHSLASHRVAGNVDIVASFDGAPAACGSLHAVDGVAWLGGAASVPEYRGRGGQAVLLAHRLDLAAASGCDLAAATAVPTGASARNLLRAGFQLVYTEVVLTRAQ